jgi:hypothetical protein
VTVARRKHAVARLRLYDRGQRYYTRYDGFGRYDTMADAWRSGQLTVNLVSAADLGTGAGLAGRGQISAAQLVDHPELGILVCRPFLDTSQSIGLGHFDFVSGQWTELKGLGLGNETKLYQYDGRVEGATGGVSRFTLPRNPVICVSIQRAMPAMGRDWASDPPYSEVQLGVGTEAEWAVTLPYGGPARIVRRVAGEWEAVANAPGGSHLSKLEGHGPGDRLLLWLAVWSGRLVVSTDGFESDVWVCTVDGGVTIPEGKVALWHNAGQWCFSVLPIKMIETTVDRQPVEAGYDTEASNGEVRFDVRKVVARNDAGQILGDVAVVDTTGTMRGLKNTQRTWRATLTPGKHTVADPAFETWVSPELHAVQISQWPELVDTGASAWQEVKDDLLSVEAEPGNATRGALCELTLDNGLGQYAEVGEYQRCHVEAGWALEDGTTRYTAVADGYLVEPTPTTEAGAGSRLEACVVDGICRLRDEKCDARSPVFDGWPVREVFEWVLDRCGIAAEERELEDTGMRLSEGNPRRPLWQVEPGRSWWEFLREVAEFDHRAALVVSPDGTLRKVCRYCFKARTAEDVDGHDGTAAGACETNVAWEFYTRPQAMPEPDEAGAVLRIERSRRTLFGHEFSNAVSVKGATAAGAPVQAFAMIPDSLYEPNSSRYVGWRKMSVLERLTHASQEDVNRLALEVLRERGREPDVIEVTVALLPELKIGDVVRIHGAEDVGAGDALWRVSAVRHMVKRSATRISQTIFEAQRVEEG